MSEFLIVSASHDLAQFLRRMQKLHVDKNHHQVLKQIELYKCSNKNFEQCIIEEEHIELLSELYVIEGYSYCYIFMSNNDNYDEDNQHYLIINAKHSFEKAIKTSPHYYRGYSSMAEFLAMIPKKYPLALKYWNEALKKETTLTPSIIINIYKKIKIICTKFLTIRKKNNRIKLKYTHQHFLLQNQFVQIQEILNEILKNNQIPHVIISFIAYYATGNLLKCCNNKCKSKNNVIYYGENNTRMYKYKCNDCNKIFHGFICYICKYTWSIRINKALPITICENCNYTFCSNHYKDYGMECVVCTKYVCRINCQNLMDICKNNECKSWYCNNKTCSQYRYCDNCCWMCKQL